MNKIIMMVIFAGIVGCTTQQVDIKGIDGTNGTNGKDGISCTVSGETLSCSDGTSFDLGNLKGDTGPQGPAGINGSSCFILESVLTCTDGSSFDFSTLSGKDGANGVDGSSCTVQEARGGALIICNDGSEVFISDGVTCDNGDGGAPSDKDSKIELCHVPRGNPENKHTIWCGSQSSADAHLRNGDYLGTCGDNR